MMNWSDYWSFLTTLGSLLALSFLWVLPVAGQSLRGDAARSRLSSPAPFSRALMDVPAVTAMQDTTTPRRFPKPTDVLYKSLLIPGWGQVVNKQIWKVPIVYGLLFGLTGYSIYLTKKYHDYRAAYYNLNTQQNNEDMRFGATPAYLQNSNPASLQDNRDFFRNRRDFIYITIALAYGLNAIDAYVFAHLRSFDVSEDLSMNAGLKPAVLAQQSPGITLSVELFNRSK